jgi:hypothetical protein
VRIQAPGVRLVLGATLLLRSSRGWPAEPPPPGPAPRAPTGGGGGWCGGRRGGACTRITKNRGRVSSVNTSAEIFKHAPPRRGSPVELSSSNGLTPQTCAIKMHRCQATNENTAGSPGAIQRRSSSCSDPQPTRRRCRGNARARLGSLPSVMHLEPTSKAGPITDKRRASRSKAAAASST